MSIRGWFVWEELMTRDVQSAISFYNKVAGLKAGKSDSNYTHLEGSNGQMGGVMALPEEAKQGDASIDILLSVNPNFPLHDSLLSTAGTPNYSVLPRADEARAETQCAISDWEGRTRF